MQTYELCKQLNAFVRSDSFIENLLEFEESQLLSDAASDDREITEQAKRQLRDKDYTESVGSVANFEFDVPTVEHIFETYRADSYFHQKFDDLVQDTSFYQCMAWNRRLSTIIYAASLNEILAWCPDCCTDEALPTLDELALTSRAQIDEHKDIGSSLAVYLLAYLLRLNRQLRKAFQEIVAHSGVSIVGHVASAI